MTLSRTLSLAQGRVALSLNPLQSIEKILSVANGGIMRLTIFPGDSLWILSSIYNSNQRYPDTIQWVQRIDP